MTINNETEGIRCQKGIMQDIQVTKEIRPCPEHLMYELNKFLGSRKRDKLCALIRFASL